MTEVIAWFDTSRQEYRAAVWIDDHPAGAARGAPETVTTWVKSILTDYGLADADLTTNIGEVDAPSLAAVRGMATLVRAREQRAGERT